MHLPLGHNILSENEYVHAPILVYVLYVYLGLHHFYLSWDRSEDSSTRVVTKLRLNKAVTLKKLMHTIG